MRAEQLVLHVAGERMHVGDAKLIKAIDCCARQAYTCFQTTPLRARSLALALD